MVNSGLWILLFVAGILLIIIAYFINTKKETTSPVENNTRQANWTQPAPGQWNCSEGDYRIAVSNLPSDITPQLFEFDAQALLQADKESEDLEIISIVADVRFLDANNNVVLNFAQPISLSMSITAQEINAMRKKDKPLSDIVVIQIKPDKDNIWKRLPDSMVDYSHVTDSENPRVIITFTTWGDPPGGYGTPPIPKIASPT